MEYSIEDINPQEFADLHKKYAPPKMEPIVLDRTPTRKARINASMMNSKGLACSVNKGKYFMFFASLLMYDMVSYLLSLHFIEC